MFLFGSLLVPAVPICLCVFVYLGACVSVWLSEPQGMRDSSGSLIATTSLA